MLTSLFQQLGSPSSEYRGGPFWSWNGTLEPETLRRQIRVMKEMGMGGFFMHPRTGLATPYLSEAFFATVAACVDEAEKLGMKAWLYDEDRYSSGSAGGMVTRDAPEFRRRTLDLNVYERIGDYQEKEYLVALYLADAREGEFSNFDLIPALPASLPEGKRILQFYMSIESCCNWFNGGSYPDLLNPEAVKRFRDLTHAAYASRFQDKFGTVIPGIFTDEPNYYSHMRHDKDPFRKAGRPWTERFPEVFESRYGHPLLPALPHIFFKTPEAARIRWEFFDCASHLFCEAFARTLGDWCEAHGLMLTGHLLLEDTPSAQAAFGGSNMRFYEFMQAPGIDALTEHYKIYDTVKQCVSVANQFDRRWRLSETYGETGWHFAFEGQKALSDWQAVLGINYRCHHLYHYTLLGRAKRDYPASIGHQSPWFREYPLVENYFARINLFLSHGRQRCDILCIHPVESAFMSHGTAEVGIIDKAIIQTRNLLLEAHLDFDYGDEDILARHGTAENGLLRVNKATYKAVVVPGAFTLRRSTLQLLQQLRLAGGLVVFADPEHIPGMLDARPSGEVRDFAAGCDSFADLDAAVRNLSIRDRAGAEIPAILYQRRVYDEDNEAVFLCNTSDSERVYEQLKQRLVRDRDEAFESVTVSITSQIEGRLIEIIPETGERFLKRACRENGSYTFETSFDIFTSRLFAITANSDLIASLTEEVELEMVSEVVLAPAEFAIVRDEPNVLVLDRAEYRLDGGDWQDSTYNLHLDAKAREHIGLDARSNSMAQPWTVPPEENPRGVDLELRYRFHVAELPVADLQFAIEMPGLYTASINGCPLALQDDQGYWIDESLRRFPLPVALLKNGPNEIGLRTRITTFHPGIESIFLLGDFGIAISGLDLTMTAAPRSLTLGDWTGQGLPFYSASVGYKCTVTLERKHGERVFVAFPAVAATCVSVWVNGQKAGTCAWAPWEVEVTTWLQDGENSMEFRACSHRRNSLGPLYNGNTYGVSPNSFEVFSGQYTLSTCGLFKAPRLRYRRRQI